MSCDALTSVVGTSKPALEERFDVRADILILSDEDSKPIVSQRREHSKIVIIVLNVADC